MPGLRQRNDRARQRSTLQDHTRRSLHQRRLNEKPVGHDLAKNVDEPIPIRTQQGHVVLLRQIHQCLLKLPAPGSHFAKAGSQDNGIANPGLRGFLKNRVDQRGRYHDKSEVYRLRMRYFAEMFHGWLTVYKRTIGIDAVDGPAKPKCFRFSNVETDHRDASVAPTRAMLRGWNNSLSRSGKMNRS